MKLNIRTSAKKGRKKKGYLTRKKSPGAKTYFKARRSGKKQKPRKGK